MLSEVKVIFSKTTEFYSIKFIYSNHLFKNVFQKQFCYFYILASKTQLERSNVKNDRIKNYKFESF